MKLLILTMTSVFLLTTNTPSFGYDLGTAIYDFSEGFLRGQAAAKGQYVPPQRPLYYKPQQYRIQNPNGTGTSYTVREDSNGNTRITNETGSTWIIKDETAGYNNSANNTAAIIAGAATLGLGLAALANNTPKYSQPLQTDQQLYNYNDTPTSYTQQQLTEARREQMEKQLSQRGIKAAPNVTVAELQDVDSRIRWADMYNKQCNKQVDWKKFTLVEMEQMALSTTCK